MATSTRPQHVKNVCMLYKAILRMHRGLPLELKALGDAYVKEEFKLHKNATPEFVPMFMKEWATYAVSMSEQLRDKSRQQPQFGEALGDKLDTLNSDQVEQLYELFKEAQKPQDPLNPLGENPRGTAGHPDT